MIGRFYPHTGHSRYKQELEHVLKRVRQHNIHIGVEVTRRLPEESKRLYKISFAVLRGGDVAGEHSVVFYGEQESLSLTHKANSRTVFARGALRAARFAAAQAVPGLFTMDDVLEG